MTLITLHSTPTFRLLILMVGLCLLAAAARGQSSYFNTPTSDVVPPGEFYVEADFDAKPARFRNGGWQSFGLAGQYGLRKNTEIGVNAYYVRAGGEFLPVEFQPNIKVQLHTSEDTGTSLAVGGVAYIPVSQRFAADAFGSVYVVGSKRFKTEWTPKISAGAYQLIGAKRENGSRRGLLFSVEQPLSRRVSLIADWNTGKNRFGYAAAGFGLTVTKRSYLYSAYYFGNEGRGNNFLGIYYGFSF